MVKIPLSLFLRNKDGIILNTSVASISSQNALGVFDILATHSQFISLIEKSIKITFLDGRKHEIPLSKGILKVYQNQVNIFLTDKVQEAVK